MARPSEYNAKVADAIIEKLTEGVPLKRICAADDMPHYTTVLRWQQNFAEFRDLFARAKQEGTHHLADQCIEIADSAEIEPANKRIMIDTRIRLIGKWNSKAYGDKIDVQHGGGIKLEGVTMGFVDVSGAEDR